MNCLTSRSLVTIAKPFQLYTLSLGYVSGNGPWALFFPPLCMNDGREVRKKVSLTAGNNDNFLISELEPSDNQPMLAIPNLFVQFNWKTPEPSTPKTMKPGVLLLEGNQLFLVCRKYPMTHPNEQVELVPLETIGHTKERLDYGLVFPSWDLVRMDENGTTHVVLSYSKP